MLIYVCSSGGISRAKLQCNNIAMLNQQYTPMSPVLSLSFLGPNSMVAETKMRKEMIEASSRVWVFPDLSVPDYLTEQMKIDIDYANSYKRPLSYIAISEDDEIVYFDNHKVCAEYTKSVIRILEARNAKENQG